MGTFCGAIMNQLIVLAACIAVASALGPWKAGFYVRFDTGIIGAGKDFFIPIPITIADAKNSRWVETPRPAGPLPSLLMFCPSQDDVAVCGLYDDLGYMGGLQIALPEDSWTDYTYDMTTQGFTRWTAPINSEGVQRSYWTTKQYFVSEEYLKKSKQEREANRVEGKLLQEQAVWVTGFNGDLMRISGVASEIADTAKTLFTEQSCIPFMGRHYYYNMTATTPCTAEAMLPWFTMVDRKTDELIATGFVTYGQLPSSALVKDYFERPPRSQIESLVNHAPECVYEMSENVGAIVMHIYYVDSPFLINCINN